MGLMGGRTGTWAAAMRGGLGSTWEHALVHKPTWWPVSCLPGGVVDVMLLHLPMGSGGKRLLVTAQFTLCPLPLSDPSSATPHPHTVPPLFSLCFADSSTQG